MNDLADLSIVIPVFNGETFLKDSLAELEQFVRNSENKIELIIVNDGSTDNTLSIVRAFAEKDQPCQVVYLQENTGKGAAIKAGLKLAQGNYVCFTDADLPYGLDILNDMLNYIREHEKIALLYGSRSHEKSSFKQNYGLIRRFGRLFFSCLVRFLAISEVSDTQCGIKMMINKLTFLVVEKSIIKRFAFDIELFVISKVNNFVFHSFPVKLRHQKESSVKLVSDTTVMIMDIFKIRSNINQGLYTKK